MISPFPNKVKPYFKDVLKLFRLHEVWGAPAVGAVALAALPALRQLLPHEVLDFIEECLLILEIPVYRRKSYIGDLVDLP